MNSVINKRMPDQLIREIKVKPANKARDRLEARGFVIGEVVVGGAMIGERGVQLL